MANIASLSSELLEHILHYAGRGDLSKASMSCKRIRDRALPLLYRNIDWTWNKSEHGSSHPPSHLLIRSIVESSTLGDLVRNVNIQAINFRIRDKLMLPAKGCKLDPFALSNVDQAITDAELPHPKLWQDAIADGSIDATVAFFLTRLPNLRRLVIGPDFLTKNDFLTMAFMHILTASPSASITRFELLEHVNLGAGIVFDQDWSHHSILYDINQYLPFFHLPKLQSAEMVMPDLRELPNRDNKYSWPDVQPLIWPLESPPCAVRLNSLRLRHSRASLSMLDSILEITPNLRTLEYDYWCEFGKSLDCNKLAQSLTRVRDAPLTNLVIGFSPFCDGIDVSERGEEMLLSSLGASLKTFTKLETLEISLAVLLGWDGDSSARLVDVLPQGLRRICFRDDMWAFEWWYWWEYECLEKFREFFADGSWRKATPRLEEAKLHLQRARRGDWELSGRDAFRTLVEGQGLRCDIVKRCKDGPVIEGNRRMLP